MGELIQGMRPCVASISQYDLNFFCLVRDKIFKIFGSLTDAVDVFVLCSMKLNFSKEIPKLGSPIGAIDVVVLCRVTLSFTEATHSLC